MLILKVWNSHKWEAYDEIDPSGKERAKGIFKLIRYNMGKNIFYLFELNKEDYNSWRKVKPSFRQGK